MDDKNTEMRKLLAALKALQTSAEQAYQARMMSDSAAAMMQQTFNSLHHKAKSLLPDDYFVNEALTLTFTDGATAEEKTVQVQIAARQLYTYLKEQVGVEARANLFGISEKDLREVQEMGRTLQEQILATTRKALKRTLSAMEIEIDTDDDASKDDAPPANTKRRVKIQVEADDAKPNDAPQTPPRVI